jgi:hypothetical protein
MQTPSISIGSAASAAVALIPSLLRHLPVQGFRMANSSEELLDLFEERYGVSQEGAVETVSDASSSLRSSSRAWH